MGVRFEAVKISSHRPASRRHGDCDRHPAGAQLARLAEMVNRAWRSILMLGCVLVASDRLSAQEDEPDVLRPGDIDAEVWYPHAIAGKGLEGDGAWLPLCVEVVSRTGREETVRIEVETKSAYDSEDGDGEATVVYETVVAPPGTPRRVWLYARAAPNDGQSVSLRIRAPRLVLNESESSSAGSDDASGDSGGGATGETEGEDIAESLPDDILFAQSFGPAAAHDLQTQVASYPTLNVTEGSLRALPNPLWFTTNNSGDSPYVADICKPEHLPDDVIGYQSVRLVILRAGGSPSRAQTRALCDWVFLGGAVVVVASSADDSVFRSPLVTALLGNRAAAAPRVEPTPWAPIGTHGAIPLLGGRRRRKAEEVVEAKALRALMDNEVVLTDPLIAEPDGVRRELRFLRRSVPDGPFDVLDGQRRLYVELAFGRGSVGVLMFDDDHVSGLRVAGLRVAEGVLQKVWSWIVEDLSNSRTALARGASRYDRRGLVDDLRDPSRDIGFGFIVSLVVLYLVTVGPCLHFLLRRGKRLTWLVWLQPLVVLVFLGLILGYGYFSKGVITKARAWTLISHKAGDDRAVRESYLAIFAGAEGTYSVGTKHGGVLKPVRAAIDSGTTHIGRDAEGVRRVDQIELDQWEEGFVVNSAVESIAPGGVEIDRLGVRVSGQTPSGRGEGGDADLAAEVDLRVYRLRITNHLSHTMIDGLLEVDRGEPLLLPTVAAGETVEVDVRRASGDAFLPGKDWNALRVASGREGLSGRTAKPRIVARLARAVADFTEPWSDNLRERVDLYFQYE